MFLQDIEDEPEFRAHMNIYRNDDVIAQLEKKIQNLDLEEKKVEIRKSPLQQDLDAGIAKVEGKERKVVKGSRKTNDGKKR